MFVDETYVKVAGVWRYVYRAVGQHGQVIDVYVSAKRDTAAARAFFQRALVVAGAPPTEVVTDRAPVYLRLVDELCPRAWHHSERSVTRTDRRTQHRPPTTYANCAASS